MTAYVLVSSIESVINRQIINTHLASGKSFGTMLTSILSNRNQIVVKKVNGKHCDRLFILADHVSNVWPVNWWTVLSTTIFFHAILYTSADQLISH